MEGYQEPKIAVSIGRKIALPGYENVDIFMSVSGIEPGASDAEIEELLVTGDRAFQILKRNMGAKVREIKERRRMENDD